MQTIWKKGWSWILLLSAIPSVYILHIYLSWTSASTILGLISCYIVGANSKEKGWVREYALLAIVALLLTLFIPVKTLYFFSWSFTVLFFWAMVTGPKSPLLLPILFFMSPFFQFVVQVFSFPIRLQLSSWAGSILKHLIKDLKVEGNVISNSGAEFSIDEVCMGLNMVVVSLLLGVVIWSLGARFQRKSPPLHHLPFWLYFLILMVCNVVMNLFRIVAIVLFKSMPGTWYHEAIGLISLLVYVVLPLIWMARFRKPTNSVASKSSPTHHALNYALPLFLILVAVKVIQRDQQASIPNPLSSKSFEGYQVNSVNNTTLELMDQLSLVYVKANPNWYQADHNPQICWKASGYVLGDIKYVSINGKKCYQGVLKKGAELMYTVWWYSNKKDRTLSQFEWRWKQFTGAPPFNLINITVKREADLQAACLKFEQVKELN